MRRLLVMSLVVLLAGCGFQLRGTGGFDLAASSVSIVTRSGGTEFAEELEDTLESIGVAVNPAEAAEYVIQLGEETTTRRPVATSGNITVSEYEVRLRAVFSISDRAGEQLVPDTPLIAERIYSFDATNLVSNTEEETILLEEMRQDLAGQLVRRFNATLRSQALSGDGVSVGET